MKREIKFRAWDKENNKWVDCFISMDGETLIDCQGGGLEDLPNIILMQYTGLKDKKGKEIYEGDIVRYWSTSHNGKQYYNNSHIRAIKWLQTRNSIGWNIGRSSNWEIIGNIYQNPELLNKNE